MRESLLRPGDVFYLPKNSKVYTKIPKKYIYPTVSRFETDANDLIIATIKIGEIYSAYEYPNEKSHTDKLDTHSFMGEYIVESAGLAGGRSQYPTKDIPDGWRIIARELKQGTYDPHMRQIAFYQTGEFSAMIENIHPIRKLKIAIAA